MCAEGNYEERCLQTPLETPEGLRLVTTFVAVLVPSILAAPLWLPLWISLHLRATRQLSTSQIAGCVLLCIFVLPFAFYLLLLAVIASVAYLPFILFTGIAISLLAAWLPHSSFFSFLTLLAAPAILLPATAAVWLACTPAFAMAATVVLMLGAVEAPFWYLLAPPFYLLVLLGGGAPGAIPALCPVLTWAPDDRVYDDKEEFYPNHPQVLRAASNRSTTSVPILFLVGFAMTLHNEAFLLANHAACTLRLDINKLQ